MNLFNTYRPDSVKEGLQGQTVVMLDSSFDGDVGLEAVRGLDMNGWAAVWSRVSANANTISGWTPILDRPEFIDHKTFNNIAISKVEGLNKSSPCSPSAVSYYDKAVWYRSSFIHPTDGRIFSLQRATEATLHKTKRTNVDKDKSNLELNTLSLTNQMGKGGDLNFRAADVPYGPATKTGFV